MKFDRIEIIDQTDIPYSEGGGGYTVIIGDKFAWGLQPDETLGVIAAALFGSGPGHHYLRSYEQWEAQAYKAMNPMEQTRFAHLAGLQKKLPAPETQRP